MNTNVQQNKLSTKERRALTIFFWFGLLTTTLLLWADPSNETAYSFAIVVYLGYKFDFTGLSRNSESPASAPDNNHWSKFSAKQSLFLILCTFATPLVFGIHSVNIGYFILCWFGLFLGAVSIIILKLFLQD